MSIKQVLKGAPIISGLWKRLLSVFRCTMAAISPTIATKLRYHHVYGSRLNLKTPVTFKEKLCWLKLKKYINDPLVIKCADKYAVREYIQRVGCEEILNELYAVYDDASEIHWDSLPNKFVLKWNFGAGFNIVCKDKNTFDRKQAIKQLNIWKRKKPWLIVAEMQYKYAPKKIICEKFLGNGEESLLDYKVYCFHGEPQAVFLMRDRDSEIKTEFFDKDWNRLKNTQKYKEPEKPSEKPACLEQLFAYARKLSAPFPFVRCDFYILNNKIYFGEMTFTPAGGLYTAETEINGKNMTEFLNIP